MAEGSDSRRSPAPTSFLRRLLGGPGVPTTVPADAFARRAEVTFLDVREPDEWRSGHIRGAVHIPLGELSRRLDELDAKRPIVVVCRSGNRSSTGTQLLMNAGFAAENLAGGMLAWQSAGLPVQ